VHKFFDKTIFNKNLDPMFNDTKNNLKQDYEMCKKNIQIKFYSDHKQNLKLNKQNNIETKDQTSN
jgi:hypothetical protein